jgi:hypothetical protein
LAECCISNRDEQLGADVALVNFPVLRARTTLFGETQGRVIVSTAAPDRVVEVAKRHGVPCARIGTVRANSNHLEIILPGAVLKSKLVDLDTAYHEAIPSIMSRTPEHAAFDESPSVVGH